MRADKLWHMSFSRLHRRFTAWLALLAVLLGALAPTVTHAMVLGSDRADWLEICGVSGMVWVKADTGEVSQVPPEGSSPASVASHCPWCTLHGGASAPPVHQASLEPLSGSDLMPAALYRAPLQDKVWVTAQSRAPPLAA